MNRLYKLLFPRKLRRTIRRPLWLIIGVMACSGWVRGHRFDALAEQGVNWLSDLAFDAALQLELPTALGWMLYGGTQFSIWTLVALVVIFALSRIVIDFPAFTKAIFWAVIRSYEHNPSRQEMLRLLMLPSSFCVAILADGLISLAAFLLGVVCLYFLSKSYQLQRLNSLTRDIMRMRSNLGFVAPQQEADDPLPADE